MGGMRDSVRTSELLKYRAEYSVPSRTEKILKAIEECDFQTFAEITIKDSNQFHAVCQLIHQLNTHFGELVATYTFDAGPNACIFLTEKFVGLVAALLRHFFAGS